MSKHYRAKVASYGFRGKYWDVDEVARDVKPEEKIPDHFAPVTDAAPGKPDLEKEINTLSELQELENPSSKAKKK